jgi:peptidoglycan-associated lipoprotein
MNTFIKLAGLSVMVAGLAGCAGEPHYTTHPGAQAAAGTSRAVPMGRAMSHGVLLTGSASSQNNPMAQQNLKNLGGSADNHGLPREIYFGFNRFKVPTAGQMKLKSVGTYLLKHAGQTLQIAGNTDPRGSAEYNLHLGQRRAEAVYHNLLAQGVAQKQLCTISYGETRPAAQPSGPHQSLAAAYRVDRRALLNYGGCATG